MKITVVGGGNIGTLMAAEMAAKGHEVSIYTSKPERWSGDIEIYDNDEKKIGEGRLANVFSDLEKAVSGAELIWVTMPAQTFGDIADKLYPYVKKGQCIGVVPGSGGAEFAFEKIIEKGCIFFGLQRVHSIARLKEYGKSVYMLGRKNSLQLASIPANKNNEISDMVEKMFDMPCEALPNYLAVTLTPSNPILHTTRLCAMFRDYRLGKIYEKNILFYEEWDDASSELLIACDNELQKLCKVLPFDLDTVLSLRTYYESPDVKAMTKKITSIEAFKGLTSPMLQSEDGWLPDFESRYFKADFSYGLKVILEIAELFDVDVPNILRVWKWYEGQNPEDAKSAFKIGMTKDEFLKLYGVE